MSIGNVKNVGHFDYGKDMTSGGSVLQSEQGPKSDAACIAVADNVFRSDGGIIANDAEWHCYELFLKFKQFRECGDYAKLIDFLIKTFPDNVKNKTFNFINTQHLFHSLYAYIPSIANSQEKERKQIRLSEECLKKLFVSTINDFKLYDELYSLIRSNELKERCPCELLLQRRNEIKEYADNINNKTFDTKPPKLKKELIDNIMYKFSIKWKNVMLKKKTLEINSGKNDKKKKRKIKKRTILTDDIIYLKLDSNIKKLYSVNGMSLSMCKHEFVTMEKQMRSSDEIVSFIKYCKFCNQIARS
jgi:hypothetical protein